MKLLNTISTVKSFIQAAKQPEVKAWLNDQAYNLKEFGISLISGSMSDAVDKINYTARVIQYCKEYVPTLCPSIETIGEHRGLTIWLSNDITIVKTGALPESPSCLVLKLPEMELPVIVVNKAFTEMPENIQHSWLDHEYGHYALGHLDNFNGRSLQAELEADAYSVSEGNHMLDALEYVLKHNVMLKHQREFMIRIQALKKLKETTMYIKHVSEISLEEIERIKQIERKVYPTHMQYMQHVQSVANLIEYTESEDSHIMLGPDWYLIVTPTEIVDIATTGKLGLQTMIQISNTLKECYGDKVFSLDARASTSYRLLKVLERRGQIKIHSSEEWYWGNEKMYEMEISYI